MATLKTDRQPPTSERDPGEPNRPCKKLSGLCWLTLLLTLASAGPQLHALAQNSSDTTSVNVAEIKEAVPPKPAALTNAPIAKLESGSNGDYARPMSSYLVTLFKQSGRPQITEGDNASYVIKATIVTPPSLTIGQSSGGKFNPFKAAKNIGKFIGGAKIPDIPENLDLANTNIVWEARCSVELQLLDKQGTALEQSKVDVVRTNSLRALSAELNGVRIGGGSAEDVGAFVRNITKTAVFEGLVNLAAYHAAVQLLPAADTHFLQAGPATGPVGVAATNPTPTPTPPSPPADEKSVTVPRGGFCSKCGVKLITDAKFCSGCGSKIAQ